MYKLTANIPSKNKAGCKKRHPAILSDFVEIAFRYEYRNGLKCSGTHKTRKESGQAKYGCQLGVLSPAIKQRDAIKRHMARRGLIFN
jgi:hypothetical protein